MSKPRAFKPPQTIYLQVVGNDDECDVADVYSEPFDADEVTWCSEMINNSDLEYRLVKTRRPTR